MPPPSKKRDRAKAAKAAERALVFTVDGVRYRYVDAAVANEDELELWHQAELTVGSLRKAIRSVMGTGEDPPKFALAGLMFLACRQAPDGPRIPYAALLGSLGPETVLEVGEPKAVEVEAGPPT